MAAPAFAFLFWASGDRHGDHVTLKSEGSTIGGGPEIDVDLNDPGVTQAQAYIRDDGDGWFIYRLDQASQQWQPRESLPDRTRLNFGQTQLVFRYLPGT